MWNKGILEIPTHNMVEHKIESLDEEQETKLFEIYSEYFVKDKGSFYLVLKDFFVEMDQELPPYVMQLKFRQFIIIILKKSLRYGNIQKEMPVYQYLYKFFLEYEEPLKEIIKFEELFTLFNEIHDEYDTIKEIYKGLPLLEKNKCIFVDFMNKVVYYYYYLEEKTHFSEENHQNFIEYFKSALLINSDF